MHGWDGQANGDRDVLQRIVALLFALAGLADLAAGLPFRRRRETLGILCRGEAAARVYFAGMAIGPLSDEDAFHDDDPADAPRLCRDASLLAARFRALGFMLAVLLTLAVPAAPPRGGSFATARAEGRRDGQRPRPLHHASRGPPSERERIEVAGGRDCLISPLEGEMPGRAEGGAVPPTSPGMES